MLRNVLRAVDDMAIVPFSVGRVPAVSDVHKMLCGKFRPQGT
jgi:hypothetical protein